MRHISRLAKLIVLSALAALALAVSAQAQTMDLEVDVQGLFGIRNSVECPPSLDCGKARIDGFGKATRTFQITGFTPDVLPGCNFVSGVDHLVLDSDGSSLDLGLAATLCGPGSSENAPDSPRSQGDPLRATGTFSVLGGTGTFADATGGGALLAIAAGDSIVIHYSGTLVLGG
jgi:hypothetical protein